MKPGRKLVVAIFSHPEYYPPTLNALEYLATDFERIYVVHRNITGFDWKYPDNVKLLHAGTQYNVRDAETLPVWKKIYYFLTFTWLLFRTIHTSKAKLFLLYDQIPWLSYRLIRWFIPSDVKLWYHNHDIIEEQFIRKWSLGWWAWKSEQRFFDRLNIFTLPALERMKYFPMEKFRGKFFFVPNYPSRLVYFKIISQIKPPDGPTRLLYQGSIGPDHGLEEIIAILNMPIAGRSLELVLKGFISENYKNELSELARRSGVCKNLIFIPPSGYTEVILNAQTCHIGIGIHKKQDIMNRTLGTASNKIYEYAASAMPVLLYDNLHFRETLGSRKWVVFTDTSELSLKESVKKIIENYPGMSLAAKDDFNSELCFENYFEPLLSYLGHKC